MRKSFAPTCRADTANGIPAAGYRSSEGYSERFLVELQATHGHVYSPRCIGRHSQSFPARPRFGNTDHPGRVRRQEPRHKAAGPSSEPAPRSKNVSRKAHSPSGKKSNEKVRVVVVDDDADMRLLLQDILESTHDFTCVGNFSNAAEALPVVSELRPDLVLMDIRMPHMTGIECTKQLKSVLPNLKIIMVTGLHDASSMDESLRAGADGYLLKPITAAQCLATIRFTVKEGKGTGLSLTSREREVMRCIAQGLLYKEISDRLGISYSAVHKYQHKIFLKLQVTNRSEAIRKWHEYGGC